MLAGETSCAAQESSKWLWCHISKPVWGSMSQHSHKPSPADTQANPEPGPGQAALAAGERLASTGRQPHFQPWREMRWDLPLATRRPGDKDTEFSSQQFSLVFTTDNPWMPLRACETQKRLYFYLSCETKMISVIPLLSYITHWSDRKASTVQQREPLTAMLAGALQPLRRVVPWRSHAVRQATDVCTSGQVYVHVNRTP